MGAPGGKKKEAKSSLCLVIHLIVSPAIRVVLMATVQPIIWKICSFYQCILSVRSVRGNIN